MKTRATVVSRIRLSSALLILAALISLLLQPALLPLPARAAAVLKVQYRVADANATDNQIVPSFNIVNTGDMAAPLSELKLRYYFTWDGTTQTQQFWCDWAQIGCGLISGSFTRLATAVPGADHYLEVGFTASAGSLNAGAQTGDIQTRFNKNDWSGYTETGDYSYDPTKTAFADWTKVTLYRNGALVWGTPPGGSGPTATNTATATRTATTAGLTATRTRTTTNGTGSTATRTRTATTAGPTATRTRTATSGTNPTATSTRTRTAVPSCGSTNVALGKAASSSSNETADFPASLAVDGVATTRWSSGWTDPQWIQVDLGSSQSICRVRLSWEPAYATGYRVEVSNDLATWTPIYTTAAGDGGIDDLTGLSGSGRYVRMYGTARATQWGYSLWELEVYVGGVVPPTATRTQTRTPTTPVSGNNLALNRPAAADSACAATEGPDKAVNGSVTGGNADKWCSLGATKWLQVDLGASYNLTRFVLKHAGTGGESSTLNTRDFTLQLSPDGAAWTTVVNVTGNTLNETSHLITAATARYVRLTVTAPTNTTDGAARIYELEVYGTPVGPTVTPNPNNRPPAAPVITEPGFEGKVANPGDVHMETGFLSDPDAGDTHRCTDWEIWNATQTERVWFTACIGGVERMHTHLGDGVYQGSHAGRTALLPETSYVLRVRHRDSSNAANDWGPYAIRTFRTSAVTIGDPNQKWAVRQAGYELEIVASNLQLPVNLAFKPNAGPNPGDPYYYVTELYGTIKVVKRDGSVSDYATGLLNYNPSGLFPGSGEQGLTGIVVDPATGDVYASMLYRAANGANYPKVVRFTSANGGLTAATQTTILDMVNEPQGQSHQVSNLTIGPDGTLYVHNGDGFDSTVGRNELSFRGKILRMNLDGSPATDNPFYSAADGINARDYIYAYGFRNPFGGAWRQADGAHYEVSNGPSVDRFAKVVRGTNYGYDGSDASMRNLAASSWPSTGAVNIAFIQPGTFGGSGFPADKQGHLYMTHSGCTFCNGPSVKRIDEWVLNADGTVQSGPIRLLDYTGTGKATLAGLVAGPDGLYFTDLYADSSTTAPTRGANVYRLRWRG